MHFNLNVIYFESKIALKIKKLVYRPGWAPEKPKQNEKYPFKRHIVVKSSEKFLHK